MHACKRLAHQPRTARGARPPRPRHHPGQALHQMRVVSSTLSRVALVMVWWLRLGEARCTMSHDAKSFMVSPGTGRLDAAKANEVAKAEEEAKEAKSSKEGNLRRASVSRCASKEGALSSGAPRHRSRGHSEHAAPPVGRVVHVLVRPQRAHVRLAAAEGAARPLGRADLPEEIAATRG